MANSLTLVILGFFKKKKKTLVILGVYGFYRNLLKTCKSVPKAIVLARVNRFSWFFFMVDGVWTTFTIEKFLEKITSTRKSIWMR